ncbi:lycopene cyclase domain-containing protein [Cellulomonas sp. NPDC055163]
MTNAILNAGVLVVLLAVSAPVLRRLRGWAVVATVLLLCVLTAVFDTIMIDVGLYEFDPAKILGLHVWGAPVEDFAYAIAAAVGMPVLWTVLGRRRARRDRHAAPLDGTADGTTHA